MKTLYLECNMGAAGDMLAAALLELMPDPAAALAELNAIGLPGVTYQTERAVRCGVTGTRLVVTVYGQEEAAPSGTQDAEAAQSVPDALLYDAIDTVLAQGEASVHILQRKLRLGQHRASHLLEQMEKLGIIAPHDGHPTRTILLTKETWASLKQRAAARTAASAPHPDGADTQTQDAPAALRADLPPVHPDAPLSTEPPHAPFHSQDVPESGTPHDRPQDHSDHSHRSMADIRALIEAARLPQPVRADVLAVYECIAEAESEVHGVPVAEIHFHEVGALDAVADIAACCLLLRRLAPDAVIVSPVHVGSGQVRCAHGLLPVPAPATALLLRDVPVYGGAIRGELCTPTGAALLTRFASRFDSMPAMRVRAIGIGCGKKEFEAANCLRAFLGETGDTAEDVLELACNLDDMTAEEIAFAQEELLRAGALDVWTTAIGMKKSRPGTMLSVLCHPDRRDEMLRLLFLHTETLGVRETVHRRYALRRESAACDTPLGVVRRKDATGFGTAHSKYEYEDLARIARAEGRSLRAVRSALEKQEKL